jgi:hypothetical protein
VVLLDGDASHAIVFVASVTDPLPDEPVLRAVKLYKTCTCVVFVPAAAQLLSQSFLMLQAHCAVRHISVIVAHSLDHAATTISAMANTDSFIRKVPERDIAPSKDDASIAMLVSAPGITEPLALHLLQSADCSLAGVVNCNVASLHKAAHKIDRAFTEHKAEKFLNYFGPAK